VRVGVVTELKADEYRVALTPAGARELVEHGHQVAIERGAGEGSAFPDSSYESVGARLVSVDEAWSESELVLKVKEPLPEEYGRLREGLTLFTYLHLAADEELTRALLGSGATCIAYETVQTADGKLPLLAPMSEVAGRLATQMGAWALEKAQGGRGMLLGGVPGVPPARVLVLGGGIVGLNAALIAVGMQADVWVLDRSVERLRELEIMLDGRLTLAMSSRLQIEELLPVADVVVGAVLIPGARAPKLVSREMLRLMKQGSVLVDVSIDQGGCFETSRPTTHSDPIYEVDGIVHYCVANMPGAVPRTSTKALTNVTLPYAEQIATLGVRAAVEENAALARGVNVCAGVVTHAAVAQTFGLPYTPVAEAIPRLPG
jgi:alanine dehydrogenase